MEVIYYFLLISLTFATTGHSEITTAICDYKGKFNVYSLNQYPAEYTKTVGICPQLLLSNMILTAIPYQRGKFLSPNKLTFSPIALKFQWCHFDFPIVFRGAVTAAAVTAAAAAAATARFYSAKSK